MIPTNQATIFQGLSPCKVVSTSNISATYYNGPTNNGVGATLTIAATSLTIDGVVLVVNDRILLAGQTSGLQNGLYSVNTIDTTVLLVRSEDFQCIEQMLPGQFLTVSAGTANAGSVYCFIEPRPGAVGVDSITFVATANINDLGEAAFKDVSNDSLPTVASISGSTPTGYLLQAADNSGTITGSVVQGNRALQAGFAIPDIAANLVTFDVTVPFSALSSGASATLIAASTGEQFRIRSLQLNGFGTNFSGGGGDRNGQVTDNTSVYSVIPAATLQSLANTQWGATGLPNPASVKINTATVAGASLVFKYSGGAADYTAGSLVITGLAERIA